MIFGEEVEFDQENIKEVYHQLTLKMLSRVAKAETSKLDLIGMCTTKSNFPADKM